MSRIKHRRDSAEVKAFIAGGPEPKIDAHDMAYRSLDGPDERAAMELAWEIQLSETDNDWCLSWANQVKGVAFYNTHGLSKTLDHMFALRKARENK